MFRGKDKIYGEPNNPLTLLIDRYSDEEGFALTQSDNEVRIISWNGLVDNFAYSKNFKGSRGGFWGQLRLNANTIIGSTPVHTQLSCLPKYEGDRYWWSTKNIVDSQIIPKMGTGISLISKICSNGTIELSIEATLEAYTASTIEFQNVKLSSSRPKRLMFTICYGCARRSTYSDIFSPSATGSPLTILDSTGASIATNFVKYTDVGQYLTTYEVMADLAQGEFTFKLNIAGGNTKSVFLSVPIIMYGVCYD